MGYSGQAKENLLMAVVAYLPNLFVVVIVITYTRAFKIGDRVKIPNTGGDVMEHGTFVTRIRTTKNVDASIPNPPCHHTIR